MILNNVGCVIITIKGIFTNIINPSHLASFSSLWGLTPSSFICLNKIFFTSKASSLNKVVRTCWKCTMLSVSASLKSTQISIRKLTSFGFFEEINRNPLTCSLPSKAAPIKKKVIRSYSSFLLGWFFGT